MGTDWRSAWDESPVALSDDVYPSLAGGDCAAVDRAGIPEVCDAIGGKFCVAAVLPGGRD